METTADRSAAPNQNARPPWLTWLLLGLGVFAASSSAVMTRYASAEHLGDAGPLAIAFWRCALGTLVLAPFAGRSMRRMKASEFRLPAIAGGFLAIHFATWLTSLDLTSISSSVLLVSLTPVFVAAAAWIFLNDRLGSRGWMGIALALAGTALVVGGGFGGSSLDGDMLALIGGAMTAGYVLFGQAARRFVDILPYAVIAYAVSAALMLPAALIRDQPLWGYGAGSWWAIAGIVIGPQLLGHTMINLVLKELDATTVSISIMAEPVIAAALGYLVFSEVPSMLFYPGGAAILLGIYLVSSLGRSVPVVE